MPKNTVFLKSPIFNLSITQKPCLKDANEIFLVSVAKLERQFKTLLALFGKSG